MFTRDDYREYFESVEIQERRMVYRLQEFLPMITEPFLVKPLEVILNDEVGHYAYLKHLLNSTFRTDDDNRSWERTHSLGVVTVTSDGGANETSLYMIDHSPGGICVEGSTPLLGEAAVSLSASTFDGEKKFEKTGIVRWTRKITSTHYMAGITFSD